MFLDNQIYKPLFKFSRSIFCSIPFSMLAYGHPAQAIEYDKVSEQLMSYDVACEDNRGCFQIISNQDTITKTSSMAYVIGQDDKGKPIETYSRAYLDDKLVSVQETDYDLSQELLQNRTFAGVDFHLIAIKDYNYDVYGRKELETVKNYDHNGSLYQTNVLLHHYDDFNLDKEIQSELLSDKPGDYKSYKTKYDVLGRAVSRSYELDGMEYNTHSQYDGADRGVLGQDFNANVSASIYDGNGHLSQMISYNQSSQSANKKGFQGDNDVQVINYEYDNYSRLIEHSLNGNALAYNFNDVGLETNFSIITNLNNSSGLKATRNSEDIHYDEFNRIKSYTDYNNVTYTITYKPDGEVDYIQMQSSVTNLSGIFTADEYEYDSSVPYWLKGLPRTQTIDVMHNGHHQVNLITKDYFSPSEVTYGINTGKLKSVRYQVSQDGAMVEDLTIHYTYDDQERVISEQYVSHTNAIDVQGGHSENNLNKQIDYEYDPLNRLIKSETHFTSLDKQEGDLSVQVEKYKYNINGDITEHVTIKTAEDGSEQVISNEYTYNEIDQLIKRVETTSDSKGDA